MSIIERFKEAFSTTEINLACSLPICNDDYEVLFFYSTKPNDDNSFIFGTVFHLYRRNIKSGAIVDNTEKLLGSNVYKICRDSIIKPNIFDDEAFDVESAYHELYEEYFRKIALQDSRESYADTCRELLEYFNLLVPDGPLKGLYEEVGADYLTHLRNAK